MKRNYNYYKMKRKHCKLPWLLTFVRGAIGKEYVIKHYRYGIIKTKYPDMTKIVASPGQRNCRDLFKAAVKHAQKVMRDPVQKAAWLKKARQKHLVFNLIIKDYMLAEKKAAKKREMQGKYIIRSCFKPVIPVQEKPAVENPTLLPATPITTHTRYG
jgi:hypothetical protein